MAGRKQETQLRTAGGIQYELTRKRVNLKIAFTILSSRE